MDDLFLLHNIQRESHESFLNEDPHLGALKHLRLVYQNPLLAELPVDKPGINTLTGGPLTGKSTLLKQWIAELLKRGVSGQAIAFYPVESVKDVNELIFLLQKHFSKKTKDLQYILLDDITHLKEWEKLISKLKSSDWLDRGVFIFVSADRKVIPIIDAKFGAEDTNEIVNFHLYPLSFRETVLFKKQNSSISMDEVNIYDEFNEYLLHGGMLVAINDVALSNELSVETLKRYALSLVKHIQKSGRQESFLREVLSGILNHYNQQITWNRLAQELAIDHPKTIGDYIALLESLDALFVQFALLEETLQPAPKKARKLVFTDPFIFHAIKCWLHPNKNFADYEKKAILNDAELSTKLVEGTVATHFSRYYPTYYIKAEGEIDLAYVYDHRFWPVVVVWSNQFQAKELKQIMKYPNGKILTKIQRSGIIEKIRTEPVPQALWKLEE